MENGRNSLGRASPPGFESSFRWSSTKRLSFFTRPRKNCAAWRWAEARGPDIAALPGDRSDLELGTDSCCGGFRQAIIPGPAPDEERKRDSTMTAEWVFESEHGPAGPGVDVVRSEPRPLVLLHPAE